MSNGKRFPYEFEVQGLQLRWELGDQTVLNTTSNPFEHFVIYEVEMHDGIPLLHGTMRNGEKLAVPVTSICWKRVEEGSCICVPARSVLDTSVPTAVSKDTFSTAA